MLQGSAVQRGRKPRRAVDGRSPEKPSVWIVALGPERLAVGPAAGIFQRGHEIFVALAFELFLGGLEACNARCDFFPLASEAIFLFGHAHPFDSCPAAIGARNWGANWDMAVQDCDRLGRAAFAVRGG